MAKTHKSSIGSWRSRLPQSAYGVPRAAGDDYRRIINTDQVPFEDTGSPQMVDNANYDTGTDVADDVWATTNDSGANTNQEFSFQDIGYDLYAALGGYAVSGAGPYTHTFTPQNMNTSRQLPIYTFGKKYGGLKLDILPDCVNTQLQIKGAKINKILVTSNFKGSGNYLEDPASYAQPALETDREYGYNQQARFILDVTASGTLQVETATIAGTITGVGTVLITVTSAKNNVLAAGKVIAVTVANTDTASQVATKVRAALAADYDVNFHFVVSGSTTAVILTEKVKGGNDSTLNIASTNGTATGLTPAATSTNTTPGVAGATENPQCQIQSWDVTLNNPTADDGYNVCSPYLVANTPRSGSIRSEYLVGTRDYMFNYEIWLDSNDPSRGWLKNGTVVNLSVPIIGVAMTAYPTSFYSLTITHTKCRIMSAKETISGNFIGLTGQVKLLSSSGSIPFSAVLVNDVASYVS